jgi:hypothetical protein
VKLFSDDRVVNIVHPIARGSVPVMSLVVILAARRALLMRHVSLACMVVPIVSLVIVMAITILLRAGVEMMINRRPLDTHCMVVLYRRPITRYPDISGSLNAIVAFNPQRVFGRVFFAHFKLYSGKSE